MNFKPLHFIFCPLCAAPLSAKQDGDRARQYCAKCDWVYYPRVATTVTGILVNNGRVLLVKRRFEPCAGTWMFPSGFLEYGENPVTALRRELEEETGLTVDAYSLTDICQSEDDPREPGHLSIFYAVNGWHGQLRNDPNENDGVDWFLLSNPPVVRLKLHSYFLNRLADVSPDLPDGRNFRSDP